MKENLFRVTELVNNIEANLGLMLRSKSIIFASQFNISEKTVELNEVSIEDYFEMQEKFKLVKISRRYICIFKVLLQSMPRNFTQICLM